MSDKPKPWEEGFDIKDWFRDRTADYGDPLELSDVEELHAKMLGRIRELEAKIQEGKEEARHARIEASEKQSMKECDDEAV